MLAARERLRALRLAAGAGRGRRAGACWARMGRPAARERAGTGVPGAAQLVAEASEALGPIEGVDEQLDGLAERLRGARAGDPGARLRAVGVLRAGQPTEPWTAQAARAPRRSRSSRNGWRPSSGWCASTAAASSPSTSTPRAARARREQLAAARVSAGELDGQLQAAGRSSQRHVRALTRARRAAAGPFSEDVAAQLATLAMPHAGFEVVLGGCEVGAGGADTVEFVIAPNPGVPGGPVREIASGGELSRVMLAILSAAQGHESGITLVFDEVDAGIGGHTARAVGSRLRELARECQVICITHLPQIASLARQALLDRQAGGPVGHAHGRARAVSRRRSWRSSRGCSEPKGSRTEPAGTPRR